MVRSSFLGICFLGALGFAACGDDGKSGDGDGAGAESGEGPGAGDGGGAGEPGAGRSGSGGKATGGRSGAGGALGTGGSAVSGSGGEGGVEGPAGAGGEGGAACVPTSPADEVCDDVDNDCNGEVDDVDVGDDGLRDCLSILVIGVPGGYPSSAFFAWIEEQSVTFSRIHTSGTPPTLTAADLNPFDVTILDDLVRDYTLQESQTLSAWVRAGGGLMSLNGHTGGVDLTRGNSLLLELGVEHVAGLISGDITTFNPHPLTTGLTLVPFQGGYLLADRPMSEGSVVVAEYMDSPVGLALVRGSGRAFVWGDEWVEYDSQLESVRPFWINALGWLSGAI